MRGLFVSLFVASPTFAGVLAPIPRGIDFQKLMDDIAAAPKGDDEDPAAILERITKNAEGIGERLKDKDTGDETREKQDQLLKDIDKLLKPPPPMDNNSGGGGSSSNPPPPMGGGKGGDMMPPPMGGSSGKPRPQRTGSRPEPMAGSPKPMPMPGMGEPMVGEAKVGPMAANENPMGKGGNSALPLEDPFTKQVWGHLPERLRQQANQYYREQYMPKYTELLKLYYSNLAEREKK